MKAWVAAAGLLAATVHAQQGPRFSSDIQVVEVYATVQRTPVAL